MDTATTLTAYREWLEWTLKKHPRFPKDARICDQNQNMYSDTVQITFVQKDGLNDAVMNPWSLHIGPPDLRFRIKGFCIELFYKQQAYPPKSLGPEYHKYGLFYLFTKDDLIDKILTLRDDIAAGKILPVEHSQNDTTDEMNIFLWAVHVMVAALLTWIVLKWVSYNGY